MANEIIIKTEEVYQHCKAQLARQIPERDALSDVIADLQIAVSVWEDQNPAPVVEKPE